MIADRLRASILQAAISGKLTDQRPEDGTATELLEQIGAERDTLVKAGKQKKQKPLPPVSADEQAFVLPANWAWTSFGETISLLSGRDLTPEQYSDRADGTPYITGASNFANGSLIINRWTVQPLTVARQGDLLITCKGTIGDLAVLEEPEAHIARQVMAITCLQVRRDYVAAFLEYSVATLKAQAKSMIPGISRDMLLFTPLPLPPLAEQERIIAKLGEVLPLIEQLAELEREREHLDSEFAQAIERAILQAAISGKLTKQLPEDGTATELLETIQTERQQLEEKGKIKKQKPLPSVGKDDEPFTIPETWKWERLGRLVNNRDSERVPLSRAERSQRQGGYPYYGASGVIDHIDSYLFSVPLVLIGEDGANLVNRSTPIAFIAVGKYWVNNHAHVLEPFRGVSQSYFATFINGTNLYPYITGTAQPKMNQARMNSIPVALPPSAEQKRIVSQLHQVMPLVGAINDLVS